jgi:hypothetical protein
VKERPRSLFFLNDSMGWMVTDGGIWFTEESGRGWRKLSDQIKPDGKLRPRPRGGLILRVWFLDAQHGFAVGLQKTTLETHNGGRTWTPVEEGAKLPGNPSFSSYNHIAFEGPNGMIVGGSTPPRRDSDDHLPLWMEPERTAQRQVPTLTILLETRNGGAKWYGGTAPLFGSVTALRIASSNALAVFGFDESFEWPSEVHRIDLSNGRSERVFREKNRRVLDSAIFDGRRGFLAAVEPPGRLNSSPIPGKVKILTSPDLETWSEMPVDYKAVARSLILAGPDAEHLWCATDTGMILHLTQ